MESKEFLAIVIAELQKSYPLAVAELKGHLFAGTDIAINDSNGNTTGFRLTVIEHPTNTPK